MVAAAGLRKGHNHRHRPPSRRTAHPPVDIKKRGGEELLKRSRLRKSIFACGPLNEPYAKMEVDFCRRGQL
uniref:Uncharacterized protein n=1 Tax=Oryza sativa subsp. japonica TaxID=39947 RepID=Q6H5M5_ORYSJ|nr:hypothetical protein [Oryza sativa Japonica Group]BAD25974.1 hypothetical protein [Oryza sativa Japonica Group]